MSDDPLESTPLHVDTGASIQADGLSSGHPPKTPLSRQLRRRTKELFSAGSVFSAVANLCSATLGVGALALPWALKECGIIPGLLLIFCAAVACNYSVHLLIMLYERTDCDSFEALGRLCFGRLGGLFTQLVMFSFCFGGAIGCVMVVVDVIRPCLLIIAPNVDLLHSRALLQLLLVVFIMLPLSMYRQIDSLRILSFIATLGCVLMALFLTAEASSAVMAGTEPRNEIRWFRVDGSLTILVALPVILYAFVCQANIFQIYEALSNKSPALMYRVVKIAVAFSTFLYLLYGVSGYVLFGDKVNSNVLENLDINDPLAAFAQAGIGVAIVLTYPLSIHPARHTLQSIVKGEEDFSNAESIVWTIVLVFGSLLVAISIPNIGDLFSFLGATTGSLIAFILPATFFLKCVPAAEADEFETKHRRISWWFIVIGIIIATSTTIRSTILIYEAEEKHPIDQSIEPSSGKAW